MLYLIIAIVLIVLGMFFFDKKSLQNDIKVKGGIRQKYHTLIDWIASSPNPIINEYKDYLTIVIVTNTIKTTFEIIPAFNTLGVSVAMDYGKNGIIDNKWEFNETKYTQQEMIDAIRTYIASVQNRFHKKISSEDVQNEELSNQTNDDSRINAIISNIQHLSLSKKIDLFLMIYSMELEEQRANILNLWYQYKHDNIYFENLSVAFSEASPKIFMPPLSQLRSENHISIYKSITKIRGYLGTEETFLENIKSTNVEFEIDRLLYITFAVSDTYNIASNDLLMLSHKNWTRRHGAPFHYDLILIKTRIDVLQHRNEHRLAIAEATRIFKVIDGEKYENKLHWLKYQFTNSLLDFYENGYSLPEFSEEYLLGKRDRYEEWAIVDDHLNNIQ